MKQKTSTRFEPVLTKETDLLSVALTTQPTMSYLLYFGGLLKTGSGGISTWITLHQAPAKKPGKQPEGPGFDKLVWWKRENRTYDNKK